jgi:hypothetical protein
MNWRDERIGLQIERALCDTRITQGCDFELLVSSGKILLAGRFVRLSDLDRVLNAIAGIPAVSDIQLEVSVDEPLDVPGRRKRSVRRQWPDEPFGFSGLNL